MLLLECNAFIFILHWKKLSKFKKIKVNVFMLNSTFWSAPIGFKVIKIGFHKRLDILGGWSFGLCFKDAVDLKCSLLLRVWPNKNEELTKCWSKRNEQWLRPQIQSPSFIRICSNVHLIKNCALTISSD